MPTPVAKGRYAVSRSCVCQPSRKVSRVTMSVKPATLVQCGDREHHLIIAWLICTKKGSGEGERGEYYHVEKNGGRNWFEYEPVELEPAVPIAICFAYWCQPRVEYIQVERKRGSFVRTKRHFLLFDKRCRTCKRVQRLRPRRGGIPRRRYIVATTSLHSCVPCPAHMRVKGEVEEKGRAKGIMEGRMGGNEAARQDRTVEFGPSGCWPSGMVSCNERTGGRRPWHGIGQRASPRHRVAC
jgi:hypothetical protein